ncbi:DUF2732 family protein [Utexia brackfieldae]|uniref:DUF2732 family protein n=1 Tax=Utexia brackfieldae TaxID=3074108 RepID=UPI00370DD269
MPNKSMQSLSGEALLAALNQAKEEAKNGLCDVFHSKLDRLASHIRNNHLSGAEAAELLDQEATKMLNEKNEAYT